MYSLGEHLVRVDIAGHWNDLDCDVVRGYKLTFDLLSIDDCYLENIDWKEQKQITHSLANICISQEGNLVLMICRDTMCHVMDEDALKTINIMFAEARSM